jgi:hypothetical protein
MEETEDYAPPPDTRTAREKELEGKLGGRTIMLVLVSVLAVIEALIITRLAF